MHSYFSPLSLHCVITIVFICSSIARNENSSFPSIIFPDSIRLISRISLISPSKCLALSPIFSKHSLVSGSRFVFLSARLSRPIMAFIGVRISWLILDKKAVFALFACSAASSASLNAWFFAIVSRISLSILVSPRPIAWTI